MPSDSRVCAPRPNAAAINARDYKDTKTGD
jgi:hypothetical protein